MSWWQQHAFLLLYIVFTTASQLIIRWSVGAPGMTVADGGRLGFVLSLLAMPWVWVAFVCTFLAGVSWMLTLSRLELTYAFPFTGVTFLLILLAGAFVFGEAVSLGRIVGTLLVVIGLIVVVRT